jgi:hypothetical protein
MSVANFSLLNYPCQNLERSEVSNDNKRRNLLSFEENKEEFCLEFPDYKSDIVSDLEYIYLLVSASAMELILLVLLYFWYNDFRRIKFLVDGQLIDSNTKENKIKYNLKKYNYANNFNLYGQNNYVAHYDIFGKPIFNFKKRKPKIISMNIYNNNNNRKSMKVFRNKNVNSEDIHLEQNKKRVEINKLVILDNKENEMKSSDKDNIYNLKFKNIRKNRLNMSNINNNSNYKNININNSRNSSSKTAVLDNLSNNNN